MRKLIENPVYMTYEEIEKEFYGKWVLVANCKRGPYQSTLGGIPVAVADTIFEGHKDGFYDRFKESEYAPRIDYNFNYENVPALLNIFPNGA